MSAETLHKAADVLRERANAASPIPWTVTGNAGSEYDDIVVTPTDRVGVVDTVAECDTSNENAAYIATMHPGVGVDLADWLDEEAGLSDTLGVIWVDAHPSMKIARAILGGAR